jgi:hypothetical protein
MLAGRVLMAMAVLATLLPLAQGGLPAVDATPATRMQVVLVDDETLLWSRPLLRAEDLAEARYHVFGVDAAGNATLLSVHDSRTFRTSVAPGFSSYGVAVEVAGALQEMTDDCFVIYLFRIPPSVAINCAPPIPPRPDPPVRPIVLIKL